MVETTRPVAAVAGENGINGLRNWVSPAVA